MKHLPLRMISLVEVSSIDLKNILECIMSNYYIKMFNVRFFSIDFLGLPQSRLRPKNREGLQQVSLKGIL